MALTLKPARASEDALPCDGDAWLRAERQLGDLPGSGTKQHMGATGDVATGSVDLRSAQEETDRYCDRGNDCCLGEAGRQREE